MVACGTYDRSERRKEQKCRNEREPYRRDDQSAEFCEERFDTKPREEPCHATEALLRRRRGTK
eukprot:COSAG02_NODE_38759_length_425_cov_0.938650_1_plen_62_part_10